MDEHGATVEIRHPQGRTRPTAAEQRAERIRAAARGRYATARTDPQRLAAAFDYARSAASAARDDGLDVSVTVADATRLLVAVGEMLTALLAEQGRGRQ